MTTSSTDLRRTRFAVIDLETTGLSPLLHDRVVEIAVVRLEPSASGGWEVASEFATLINPERDCGPTHLHGITASELAAAPTFAEVAGDIAERLAGGVLVAHNARFDLSFLQAEYRRAGVAMPSWPSVCTLRLACRLAPRLASRRLGHLCEEAGIKLDDAHSAAADAQATAHLLVYFVAQGLTRGWRSVADLGFEMNTRIDDFSWAPAPSGRAVTRAAAASRLARERTYLATLVERLPPFEALSHPAEADYLSLLDRALEDRLVTSDEAHALVESAAEAGLTRGQVLDLHRQYLQQLVRAALYDGVVTASERTDLEAVCGILGQHRATLDALLATAVPEATPSGGADLVGKRVCFTGTLQSRLDGSPISRELAERLAREAGLEVAQSVTKALDVLVVNDPATQSSKAMKARRYGIRLMAEAVFWRGIGVAVQ